MWQRFTERARRVILLGQEEAAKMNGGHVGTEHLLLGLLLVDDGTGAIVLRKMSIEHKAVRAKIAARSEAAAAEEAGAEIKRDWLGRQRPASLPEPKLTNEAKRVLELAADEARRLRHNYIGTEHLLLGLLRQKDGDAASILGELGMGLEQGRYQVLIYLGAATTPEPSAPAAEMWEGASDKIIVRVLEQMLADENMAQKILVASGLDIVAARERIQKFLGDKDDKTAS